MNNKTPLLHLFCAEGEGGGDTCAGAAADREPLKEAQDGTVHLEDSEKKPAECPDRNKRAEFEKLIKGEFRELYEERVKAAIDRRFKNADRETELSKKLPLEWFDQAGSLAEIYPDFDFRKTVTDPENGKKFMAMLAAGFTVRDAYEALNKNEIMDAMMRYAAEKIREKTINDIRARGLRPDENGADSAAARTVKSDPSTWTAEEMENVVERVRRGERIVL